MSRRLRMTEQGGHGMMGRGLPLAQGSAHSTDALVIPTSGRVGTVGAAIGTPSPVARQERGSGAGPVFPSEGAGRPAPGSSGWALRSRLDLAAFPSAVPCVRLHARQIVWEWGLGGLAETVELVVSDSLNLTNYSFSPFCAVG